MRPGWGVDLSKNDFIGKAALQKIHDEGVSHKLAGLRMGGQPITWYPADFYHVFSDGELVGYVTSAWFSPMLGSNIAFAMLPIELTELGTNLQVALPKTYAGDLVDAEVVKTPFKKPDSLGTGLLTTGTKL